MSLSPVAIALALTVFAGCGFALLKGGTAERGGGILVLANLVLLGCADLIQRSASAGVFGLVVDGMTALGLLGITLRFGSLWLGAAMLLYAAQFSLHAFYFVTERPLDNLHAIINNIIFVGVMWSLVFGTAVAWRARRILTAT